MLERITLDTIPALSEPPAWGVIWLHGLGADGNDFVPIVPELRLPPDCAVRFVFPHAPMRPVTVNGGMVMRAWYDILAMGALREVNQGQLQESQQAVYGLMDELNRDGIPDERILLIGFSQGGAVAYEAALEGSRAVAGLACLSTYRVNAERTIGSGVSRDMPQFVAHGLDDPVVPMTLGRQAFEALQQAGFNPQWHDYPMEHQVCLEEIEDLSHWLQRRVGLK